MWPFTKVVTQGEKLFYLKGVGRGSVLLKTEGFKSVLYFIQSRERAFVLGKCYISAVNEPFSGSEVIQGI